MFCPNRTSVHLLHFLSTYVMSKRDICSSSPLCINTCFVQTGHLLILSTPYQHILSPNRTSIHLLHFLSRRVMSKQDMCSSSPLLINTYFVQTGHLSIFSISYQDALCPNRTYVHLLHFLSTHAMSKQDICPSSPLLINTYCVQTGHLSIFSTSYQHTLCPNRTLARLFHFLSTHTVSKQDICPSSPFLIKTRYVQTGHQLFFSTSYQHILCPNRTSVHHLDFLSRQVMSNQDICSSSPLFFNTCFVQTGHLLHPVVPSEQQVFHQAAARRRGNYLRHQQSKWIGSGMFPCSLDEPATCVSQGRICLDMFTFCHTEKGIADHTCYLI